MTSAAIDTIPLFPLSHGVFPDGMLQLQIFEVRYLDLIKRCHREQKPFGVAWLKKGSEVQVPGEQPLMHTHGCMAHIRDGGAKKNKKKTAFYAQHCFLICD